MATEESPAVPPAPNPEVAATPPPTPIEEVQAPVVEGTPCDPEGARGRTVEEVDLRCVRDADGDLVWQIN